MQRNVALGIQSFPKLRENNYFYIDKTHFIKEWWERGDDITLITRPRRFGKTLMLDMVKTFFSPEYYGRSSLFEGLYIWNEDKYKNLQGTIPVIFLSFANIKETTFSATKYNICSILTRLYSQYSFIASSNLLNRKEIIQYDSISRDMSLECAKEALSCLSEYITRYYNKKPIILIDEYDTPMQEAWIHGYWDDIVSFFRGFFNSTFKTNPWLDRGLMTGITRISKDSLFSDMNNLEVVTVTSPFYSDCFGFTEEEVFASLDEYGLGNKDGVKAWYDGFTFGCDKDIYNPWSIIQYIRKNEFDTYWVDTSSNSLVSSLIQQSKKELKIQFESLLQGKSIITHLDEQIVFNQLKIVPSAVLSLLIATGYLNVVSCDKSIKQYEIEITNYEVRTMLEALIKQWFNSENLYSISHEFRNALCECRIDRMNLMMNKISMETFSYFDMSGKEPEKFYHGFTLGLIADLKGRYQLESNRESGYGRYDVMLFPLQSQDPGIVIEFKSLASDEGEKDLDDTLAAALKQIADRQYVAALEARGIPHDHIYAYGFAFHGKDVLIGGGKL